jgi:hypothetical protein
VLASRFVDADHRLELRVDLLAFASPSALSLNWLSAWPMPWLVCRSKYALDCSAAAAAVLLLFAGRVTAQMEEDPEEIAHSRRQWRDE